MTPRVYFAYLQAYNEKMKQEQDEKLILTYLGAYWQRVKTMPDLKKLLGQEQPTKEQSAADMLAEVKRINAAFGGTEI